MSRLFFPVLGAITLTSVPAASFGQTVVDDRAIEAGLPSQATHESKTEDKEPNFQLKPRWRVQYDVGKLSVPDHVTVPEDGWNDILRRAYIGVDASFGGGWGARIEAELATPEPEFTDLYLSYAKDGVTVTAGQQKVFQSLDDMTSDLQTSFAERAAFVQAFNFTRRTGVNVSLKTGDILLQGAVNTDPLIGLNDAGNNSLGIDGRVAWTPKLADTQLHLAASGHWRDRNDLSDIGLRYRARPGIRTTDIRFVSTPAQRVERELGYGLEAAAVRGRFHGAAESYWLRAGVPGIANPTYWGGYGEVGVFLTGDSRPLKDGTFGTIKPKKPFGSGGIGAVQVNARYDWLDLNSRGSTGGKQQGMLGALIWIPIENVRFSANAARFKYSDAVIAGAGGDRDYSVTTMLFRFQLNY